MKLAFLHNNTFRDARWALPAALLFAAALAALQSGGFWGFFAILLVGFFLLGAALRWAAGDAPDSRRALAWILAVAFLARLLVAVSLTVFLPLYGHGNEEERAGYVFTDSYRRDAQAWELAQSDAPLWEAFGKKYYTDQYGGLLALSAGVYRYLSPDVHRPLMISLLAALVAALGIPFAWIAARRLAGIPLAKHTAWILALYPEAVLTGSAQMREPFLMTFLAMMVWGFLELHEKNRRAAWSGMGAGAVGLLLFSPATLLASLFALGGWEWFASERRRVSWKFILVAIGVFFVGVMVFAFGVNRGGAFSGLSPLSVIQSWGHEAVKWDFYQLERGSGWIQKLFGEMGRAARILFVAVYGTLRPLLPAALVVPSNPLWKIIGILRAAGWYALLPFLLYGGIAAWKNTSPSRRAILWAGVVSWTWIFIASLRAGGDQWDNPRYRVIFLLFQALFAGYAWLHFRERRDAFLPRILGAEVAAMVVFLRWYIGRYNPQISVIPFWASVLWSVALIALIFGASALWNFRKR